MKVACTALALLATLSNGALAQECVTGGFFLEIEGKCTADSLLEAYDDQVFSAAGSKASSCVTTAADDLAAKLVAAGLPADPQALCDYVYSSQEKIPFTEAANRGVDLHFESMFFNGRTDWQEEVETLYETDDLTRTSILKEDAEAVRTFYRSQAQGSRVDWPGSLPNFQSSATDSDGLATCTTNAAMCCWPKDRQANDNNGNCATPYDENCVDKNPADNTNLCYVDMERGNQSTGLDTEGIVAFPGDNANGEGAIHCHGLAWANDVNDHTARYKANNLFFVSMYDHMYQRGYVKNIPGAPMCGCVEQMPTVSRSDCTQVDLVEKIEISFNPANTDKFTTKLAYVDVDFNSCRGINNRNNDLWAYMARLFYQGDITNKQFGEAGRIITNTGCGEATNFALNQHDMTPGYDHDVDVYSNVAGRESMYLHDHYGHRAFNKVLVPEEGKHFGIIYRACRSCVPSHMKIFYRRLTEIPDDLNLIHNILYSTSQVAGNVWNVDFTLHSTYDDAVDGLNPWQCPNDSFHYGATFYGECSPDGTRVRNQRSRINAGHDKRDTAFFANKAEADGLQIVPTTPIKGRDYARGIALKDPVDDTIYMQGAGRDIWNWHDDFNFLHEDASGDTAVTVHVSGISNVQYHEWSKSGILFRSGLETNAATFIISLTGSKGVCSHGRYTTGAYPQSFNCVEGTAGATEAWIRVEKRMDQIIGYHGVEDENGDITWNVFVSKSMPGIGGEDDSYVVGLGVSSVNWHMQEAIFSGYHVEPYHFPSAAPSTSLAPTNNHGKAAWQIWRNVGGTNLSYLKNLETFPDSPDEVVMITEGLEIPPDTSDNYGSRLWTYIKAPVSGNYTFWVAGDDYCELWLSTSAVQEDKVLIAYINGWTSFRQFDKYTSQRSPLISLEADKTYFIEALQKEGGGGDSLSVAWAMPGVLDGDKAIVSPQFFGLDPPVTPAPVAAPARKLRGA